MKQRIQTVTKMFTELSENINKEIKKYFKI